MHIGADKCVYCHAETDRYIVLGRGSCLSEFLCCEHCYNNVFIPLPDYQKDAMAEAGHTLAMINMQRGD